MAASAGVHGIYVGNFLSGTLTIGDAGEVSGCYSAEGLGGLAYVGHRGNLVAIEQRPFEVEMVAPQLLAGTPPWRIALGPTELLTHLAKVDDRPALVLREQVYYGCTADEVIESARRDDVRPAERRDVASLVEAALELNSEDLGVDPARVHRGWLRESIRRRIRMRQTMVIGPVGDPWTKLDFGSCGPCGMIVEGVFTRRGQRGNGLARSLVASVAATIGRDYPMVCLHVAADNEAARRAYAGAGMRPMQSCSLLLRAERR